MNHMTVLWMLPSCLKNNYNMFLSFCLFVDALNTTLLSSITKKQKVLRRSLFFNKNVNFVTELHRCDRSRHG